MKTTIDTTELEELRKMAAAVADAHHGTEVRWNRQAAGSLGMGHYVGSWPEVAAIKRLAEDHMPAAETADKQVEPVGPVMIIHPPRY